MRLERATRLGAQLAASLLAACTSQRVEQTATQRFRFDARERPLVEVRVERGSIEVVGTGSSEIAVSAVKKARGPSRDVAAALLDQILAEAYQRDRTVRVELRIAGGWRVEDIPVRSSHLRSDVRLHVPREADLDLLTEVGGIEIENVFGRIEVETGDGRVRLRDVGGRVRARTSDGPILISRLEGDLDASTGDGRIELDGRFRSLQAVTSDGPIEVRCGFGSAPLAEEWILRTSDGSIELTLPASLSAEIDASASDGHIESHLDLVETERTENRLRGRMGGGGTLILIRTEEGRIRLGSS